VAKNIKINIQLEIQHIPEILSFFNLPSPLDIIFIKNGISNHNYLIKTQQNDYVVKFLINQTAQNIKNEIAIQKQLNHAGIKTLEYIQNKNKLYVFNDYNVRAVVSQKIDGVTPSKTNVKLAHCFGYKLALFHKYVTKLPYKNNRSLMNPNISGVHSDIFKHSIPKGIIHGDLHLGNVLVEKNNQDKIIALFDFEEAGENFYLIDLAVTTMGICSSGDKNTLNPNLIQATILGYESVRKLNQEEKALFSQAINYAAESWIKWFENNNYEKYAKKHKNLLKSFTELNSSTNFFNE